MAEPATNAASTEDRRAGESVLVAAASASKETKRSIAHAAPLTVLRSIKRGTLSRRKERDG